jgi:glucose-1-phosphate thymidylyltransferase
MQAPRTGFGKGIVYAGRDLADLYPATAAVPKALLPVYDKPLVYYAISILLLAGIREVALVTRARDRRAFERLLGDGQSFGLKVEYLDEPETGGASQSLLAASAFIAGEPVALVLGDSVIYGDGLQQVLADATRDLTGATIFAHPVTHPERHAIVELAADGHPTAIVERSGQTLSNLGVMGISFHDGQLLEIVRRLEREKSGGFSLADIHRAYLAAGKLRVTPFGRGFASLDTSTHAALTAAANFIETIESTHGLKIACLEEIAYRKGFLSDDLLAASAASMANAYGDYLQRLLPRSGSLGR